MPESLNFVHATICPDRTCAHSFANRAYFVLSMLQLQDDFLCRNFNLFVLKLQGDVSMDTQEVGVPFLRFLPRYLVGEIFALYVV